MSQFAIELEDLNRKLLEMGGTVERAIHRSVQALLEQDMEAAQEVIRDQPGIDRLEMEIDGLATRLLALRQPVARDLRLLTVALKINADLRRMGELAAHVAERSISLISRVPVGVVEEIPQMGALVESMLLTCLQALVGRDAGLAHSVPEVDNQVDALRDAVYTKVQVEMQSSPTVIPPAVDLIFVARDLERFGDHAKNIAEDIVFLVTGGVDDARVGVIPASREQREFH